MQRQMGALTNFIVGLTLLRATAMANVTNYCTLDCHGIPNSACDCSVAGEHCFNPEENKEQLRKFRIWMVEIHNDLRNKLALGHDNRAGMAQGVANMHTIDYDLELEHVARCFMNKCQKGHDRCRRTSKFTNVGQNIHFTTAYLSTENEIKKAASLWYEEINQLTHEQTQALAASFDLLTIVRHFTQMAWARTTHIGCARFWDRSRKISGQPDKYAMVMVCNYGPAGNTKGESMLKKGKACSDCAGGICNQEWEGLCGVVTLPGAKRSAISKGSCNHLEINTIVVGFVTAYFTFLHH